MKVAAQILIGLTLASVAIILRRSDGVLWRLVELPDLLRGQPMRHAVQGIRAWPDRMLMRGIVALGYLCSTVSVFNDAIRERFRSLLLEGTTAKQGRREMREFLLAMAVRPPAIALWSLLVACLGTAAGVTMQAASLHASAISHMLNPHVMALVVLSLSRSENGSITIDERGGRRGPFLVALRVVTAASVISLVAQSAWTGGGKLAFLLGLGSLAAASLGGAAPVRHWIRTDKYHGWRRRWIGMFMVSAAGIGAAATAAELVTYQTEVGVLVLGAHMLGAVAFAGGSVVLALMGREPPGPGGFDLTDDPLAVGPAGEDGALTD